ncbi:MAG: glutamine--fructose-6-phosphate aminotransferase, partial [Gemmatimonadota bacterium]
MCGIVGYIGSGDCREILLAGLSRLEYRGSDSAGIAVLDGELRVAKCAGRGGRRADARWRRWGLRGWPSG